MWGVQLLFVEIVFNSSKYWFSRYPLVAQEHPDASAVTRVSASGVRSHRFESNQNDSSKKKISFVVKNSIWITIFCCILIAEKFDPKNDKNIFHV